MSNNRRGSPEKLTCAQWFLQKWKLNVDHKKTKCMIFSKASNPKNIKFTINYKIIENTKEFKYLGISINSKDCTFKPTLSNLSSKANKAIYSLLSRIRIKVTPLLYGSEVWASFMTFDWKQLDTIQIEEVHT